VIELATIDSTKLSADQHNAQAVARARPIVGEGPRPQSRYQRRTVKARDQRFTDAVAFAYRMDWPLNVGITVSWSALVAAGEHHDGHCLGRGEWERDCYLRHELARCRPPSPNSSPFVALWGRDVGRKLGSHIHLSLYWPAWSDRYIEKLSALLERMTGSSADYVLPPYTQDTVARSVCGGWQVDMNRRRDSMASALEWARYIAEQDAKHPGSPEVKGKAFGISQAIGKAAQERARGMLECGKAPEVRPDRLGHSRFNSVRNRARPEPTLKPSGLVLPSAQIKRPRS